MDELIDTIFIFNIETYNFIEINNNILTIVVQGLVYSLMLGLKTCLLIFVFIWVRASFPRIRYDQLMSYCWTVLLPIIIAFIIVTPCLVFSLSLIPAITSLDAGLGV